MTNDRPYRKAVSSSAVFEELRRNAGMQLDPDLVGNFVTIIMNQLTDRQN